MILVTSLFLLCWLCISNRCITYWMSCSETLRILLHLQINQAFRLQLSALNNVPQSHYLKTMRFRPFTQMIQPKLLHVCGPLRCFKNHIKGGSILSWSALSRFRILVQLAQELSGWIHTLPPHWHLDAFSQRKRVPAFTDLARPLVHVSQASPPPV